MLNNIEQIKAHKFNATFNEDREAVTRIYDFIEDVNNSDNDRIEAARIVDFQMHEYEKHKHCTCYVKSQELNDSDYIIQSLVKERKYIKLTRDDVEEYARIVKYYDDEKRFYAIGVDSGALYTVYFWEYYYSVKNDIVEFFDSM